MRSHRSGQWVFLRSLDALPVFIPFRSFITRNSDARAVKTMFQSHSNKGKKKQRAGSGKTRARNRVYSGQHFVFFCRHFSDPSQPRPPRPLCSSLHLSLYLSQRKQEATSRAKPSTATVNHHTPSPTAMFPPPIPSSSAAAGKGSAAAANSRGPFQSPPSPRRSVSGVFSSVVGSGKLVAPASASRAPPQGGKQQPSIVPSSTAAAAAAASCDLLTPLPSRKRQRKLGGGPTPLAEGGLLSAAAEAAPVPSAAATAAAASASASASGAARRPSAAAQAEARPAAPSELDTLEAALDSEVPGFESAGVEGMLSPPPRLTARMRAALLRRSSSNGLKGGNLAAAAHGPLPRVSAFSHPSFAVTAASNGEVEFGELAAAGKLAREEREREAREVAAAARLPPSRPKRGGARK